MPPSTGVFVLRDSDTLVPMQPASIVTEDDFQALIARFPALLAGDQIDTVAPRRFLLVSREQGIADDEGAGGRWSLDHLFLDQDGVPTLVEIKRASDTRLRREVVGQMLDYAAHGVLFWPAAAIRAQVEARCVREGIEVAGLLATLVGEPVEPDTYWARVGEHLQAGRVRLLFVADRIPPELRRVVEFLNRQMQPAEVLAVELRQYEGEGLRTLVPIVVGQTQDAAQKKGAGASGPKRHWDEASFFAEIEARLGADFVARAEPVRRWMARKASGSVLGSGQVPSLSPVLLGEGQKLFPFSLWANGTLMINFQYMLGKPVFGDEAMRRGLLDRLNAIGFGLPDTALGRRPSIKPETWTAEGQVEAFVGVMDWFAAQLQAGFDDDAALLPQAELA